MPAVVGSWMIAGWGAVSPVRWCRSGVLFSLGHFSVGLSASCCVAGEEEYVDKGKGGAKANARGRRILRCVLCFLSQT